MLILTRFIGESLMVGDDVRITVLSQRQGRISLGISAPKRIGVHREEIYEKVKAKQQLKPPPPGDAV